MRLEMIIINSREFRSNQSKYLELVSKGEGVILKTRSLGSFKITPVTEDDTLISKADMLNKLEQARNEILSGKGKTFNNKEELASYLNLV
ncbi:MAG: prevent-host-death protein [Bacteroidales bacterium]|nr:prevent-host-death protein [Bacteroidales bacterium]